jgi:hypothetical protein
MNPRPFSIQSLLCLMLLASAAQAITITFDGTGLQRLSGLQNYTESGVVFKEVYPGSYRIANEPPYSRLATNGTNYVNMQHIGATLGLSDGGIFELNSMDVAEYTSDSYFLPTTFNMLAIYASNAPYPYRVTKQFTFTTDGIFHTIGSSGNDLRADFETFTFGDAFKGLIGLELPAGVMIDNIKVTPVPEPTGVWLVGLGLLGAVVRRRRMA